MRHSAVWACVDLISELLSTMPWNSYRTDDSGLRVPYREPMVLTSPSLRVDPINWRRQILVSWLLRGNAYGLVLARDNFGYPTAVEIVDPDRVSINWQRRFNQGLGIYDSYGPVDYFLDGVPMGNGTPNDTLVHWPSHVVPGIPVGLSPIVYAASKIGMGLAADRYGSQWYGGGGHPTGILTADQPFADSTQAKEAKQRFKEATKDGDIAILGGGLNFQPIQLSPAEAAFLDTSKATKTDIAGYYRVEPEVIGAPGGKSMTYANMEQLMLRLKVMCFQPWTVRLQQVYFSLTPKPTQVLGDMDFLNVPDLEQRMKAHEIALRIGLNNRDERRRMENQGPLANNEGSKFNWPPWRVVPDKDQPGYTVTEKIGAPDPETDPLGADDGT